MKSPSRKKKRNSRSGFTIVEIILVIALIMLLSGVVIVQVGNIFGDSQNDVAVLQIKNLETPLTKYRIDMGSYPSSTEGLNALIDAPSGRQHLWKGPYADAIPQDPWKTEFKYVFPGEENPRGYDIRSAGPDRQFNTADDIGNWK
jgi:general secretion pathway protein G